jgi:hypothetical protein
MGESGSTSGIQCNYDLTATPAGHRHLPAISQPTSWSSTGSNGQWQHGACCMRSVAEWTSCRSNANLHQPLLQPPLPYHASLDYHQQARGGKHMTGDRGRVPGPLAPRQLAPRQLASRQLAPRQLPHDISPHGHFAPPTFRPMDISPHGHFAPRTFCPTNNSPHGQLAPRTFRPTDISPHEQLAPVRTKSNVEKNM